MIPEAFDYVRAESVDDALAALTEHGDEAKLLAGGHSLIPLLKLRLAAPAVLVDISRMRDLSYVRDAGDHVEVGALTRHRDVHRSELLVSEVPVLAYTAGLVGDPQVRARGTIGGSVAHGDPASDLPATLLALEATFVVQGPGGRRELPSAEFFTGFLETALAPDEMLVEIRVPKARGARWSFQKFNRRAQDWAIVGAAVVSNGATRVALVNMGPTPQRAFGVERALAGGASIQEAAALADEETRPTSDLNASDEYRRHLARVLVRRGLEEASGG